MKTRTILRMVPALVFGAACAPSTDDSDTVVSVDSAGIAIVSSGVVDHSLDWNFEHLFTIGGDDDGPGSFTQVRRSTIATDGAGRIYAIDDVNIAVQVFDTDGNWEATIGREGEGPGEFERPYSLAVTSKGSVLVYDFSKRGLVVFGPDGSVMPERRGTLQPPTSYGNRHLGGWGEDFVANVSVRGPPRTNLLGVFAGPDTTLIASKPIPNFQMKDYASCGTSLRLPPVFFNFIAWDVSSDRIAYSAWPDYAVTVKDGEVTRSVRRDFERRRATRGRALEDVRDDFGLLGICVIPAAEVVDAAGFEDFIPWIDGVALAPSGELWVRRFEIGNPSAGPVDVFDATGSYVGTVPEGGPALPVLFLPDDRIALIETDEFDVQRLVVAQVRR